MISENFSASPTDEEINYVRHLLEVRAALLRDLAAEKERNIFLSSQIAAQTSKYESVLKAA